MYKWSISRSQSWINTKDLTVHVYWSSRGQNKKTGGPWHHIKIGVLQWVSARTPLPHPLSSVHHPGPSPGLLQVSCTTWKGRIIKRYTCLPRAFLGSPLGKCRPQRLNVSWLLIVVLLILFSDYLSMRGDTLVNNTLHSKLVDAGSTRGASGGIKSVVWINFTQMGSWLGKKPNMFTTYSTK